ncbi:hypothetical protein P280DRAFT_471340 [Massarina eburnea CBS 473.64]|uniref:Uncharacterized protein n=1 Tax=Massarina eburnea CBS 473.64 TaxID=1395130 RepID=A0A6A6RRF8_9PLEO|nr:hypothetical protein P280DRAFT_471340 [Massarina eburnea CBS 473.64]
MVYNWDDKKEECLRLYVLERKNLDQVIEYWEQRDFTPSKRAFQTQFKRWGFPSKHKAAHKNPVLIARVKQLWEKNATQQDMLDTLQAEGHQINDRELMRLRLRFQWYLRESRTGTQRKQHNGDMKKNREEIQAAPQEDSSSEEEGSGEDDAMSEREAGETSTQAEAESQREPLDPEEALRRQLRQQQMQFESDEKWRTRKRRRRTRGWAGLPADAPGEPPRFPSETTIDESKAYLSLDNKLYREMRDQFQTICAEEGVMKKTIAGPEKWAQLLQRLIRENDHLASVFRQEPELLQQSDAMWRPKNYKSLSLDVICQDVTKRMRVMDSRMGLPEVKNVLGLNPEQTRHARAAFLAILKADHFTNRFESGDDHWNSLKQRWVQESEQLRDVVGLAGEQTDPQHTMKLKAIEVLARDVMKRFRAQKDTTKPKQVHQGPGPGPAAPSAAPASSTRKTRQKNANSGLAPQRNSSVPTLSAATDFEIDPSLLLAASDASIFPQDHNTVTSDQHQSRIHRLLPDFNTNSHSNPHSYTPSPHMQSSFLPSGPLPIYFRLHPLSDTPMPNKTVWLSILQEGTFAEVKTLALREHPGTVVVRLEGVIVHRGGGIDREVAIAIDDDAELNAFLGHVGSGKATFVVLFGLAGNGLGGGFI